MRATVALLTATMDAAAAADPMTFHRIAHRRVHICSSARIISSVIRWVLKVCVDNKPTSHTHTYTQPSHNHPNELTKMDDKNNERNRMQFLHYL